MERKLVSPEDVGVLQRPTDRRTFLTRATLGLALPAIAACSPGAGGDTGAEDRANGSSASTRTGVNNDDAAPVGTPADQSSAAPVLTADSPYTRYDPRLPPLGRSRTLKVNMVARDLNLYISRDVVVPAWTFNGTVPGPIVRCRVGDTVEFTLTNEGKMPHSMDFHAAQINPKEAFRSILPGQSVSYTFRPKYAGAFMYHCGTQPVLLHIGSGMYGAIIVDPAEPLPPAKEFVLVQSEFYVGKDGQGKPALDFNKMMATLPDHVVFNGIASQYMEAPIVVKKGDRVRFYVVSAGPTHPCSFHIVGEQFDTVYLGAPPANMIRGVQTVSVPPGGGMIFEMDANVVGEFPFVNHGFGHGQKGAVGFLVVES